MLGWRGSAENVRNFDSKSVFLIDSWGAWDKRWYCQYCSDRSMSHTPGYLPVPHPWVLTCPTPLGTYRWGRSGTVNLIPSISSNCLSAVTTVFLSQVCYHEIMISCTSACVPTLSNNIHVYLRLVHVYLRSDLV